jgi:hypothetical protein
MDICRTDIPRLTALPGERTVACHLFAEKV